MSGARDTELLNYIRTFGQTEASSPPCKFEHSGITVSLSPKLAKQFEPPADHMAFAEFMEEMLPHCEAFRSTYPGTRAENTQKVLQAFMDHFLTPTTDNPTRSFQRYGHKGRAQPYGIWFLKCFCNFLKERYPSRPQVHGGAVAPAPPSGKSFRSGHPTPFIAATVSESPAAPSRRTARRSQSSPPKPPQSTRVNPFHQPGCDAANAPPAPEEFICAPNDDEEPADPGECRRAR